MTNSDDNKNYREVRQETHTDNDGNTHTNVTRSSETVDNSTTNSQSYQSGYIRGRSSERNYEEALTQRDDENTSRGLLIGVVLAGLAALIGSAFWYFNQSSQTVDTTTPTTSAPIIISPSPAAIQTPQPQQTTIIERTKEVPVPVPVTVEKTKEVPVYIPVPQQKTAPAPSSVNTTEAPNINITVPPQQPAAKQTPAPQVSPAPSSSSNTSNSSSNTSTTSQSVESIPPSDVAPE
jgi:outer membrane biosynthesis protein TonB